MRAAYLIVLSLCFLLLRSQTYAYARAHHHKICYSPAQNIEKERQLRPENKNLHRAAIKNSNISEKQDYFINDENEDENDAGGRKYILLTKFFFALSCTFLFGYLCNQLKSQVPHWRYLSNAGTYIYLTQRVLRI